MCVEQLLKEHKKLREKGQVCVLPCFVDLEGSHCGQCQVMPMLWEGCQGLGNPRSCPVSRLTLTAGPAGDGPVSSYGK